MDLEAGRFFADLHIHSRYSRATSSDLSVRSIYQWSQIKGISLVGTGDFTHPAWLDELDRDLVEDGSGLLSVRPDAAVAWVGEVPEAARREVRFVISGEVSSIFKKNGRTRKVHSLIFMPSLDAARRFSIALGRVGNVTSDGRPILGLEPLAIFRLVRDICPDSFIIPAHVWTPHFSVFGAMSGFDSLEECFEDMTGEIFAIETGLSSDVPMNRRWSALDRLALTSSSDAHSPSKLGREATILAGELSWRGLVSALKCAGGPGRLLGTVEFFPEEGKYHVDGHRKCGFFCDPSETTRLSGRCPVCGGRLTPGVLGRVEQLADRPADAIPEGFPGQIGLIPLAEIVAGIQGCGDSSRRVEAHWKSLIARFGGELDILTGLEPAMLDDEHEYAVAEALRRMRAGRVFKDPGYDGEYGRIGVFLPGEAARFQGQGLMFGPGERRMPGSRDKGTVAATAEGDLFAREALTGAPVAGLTPEQEAAVGCSARHCLVVAGPGTGKTRTLVARAARLVSGGADPARILVVTFTNRASDEARERLHRELGEDRCPVVTTFHALALRELSAAALAAGANPPVVVQDGDVVAATSADAVTLDALVPRLVAGLRADRAAFRSWDHILVDEFQDISDDQYEMLGLIAGADTSVFCVGDPDQSIYGFRGAVPAVFERFAADHPAAARHVISVTYRLTPPVVAIAGFVIGSGGGSAGALKSAYAGPRRPEPVVLCRTGHVIDEGAWVAGVVTELVGGTDMLNSRIDVSGAGLGDFAVLGRTHQALEPVAAALREAGLPFEQASDAPLWNHEWARAVISAAASADPARPFEDLAGESLAVSRISAPPRQLKALLALAEGLDCGAACRKLALLNDVDAFGLNPERIHLLTVHASKGLEFENVFVVGLNDGMVPLVSRDDFDEDEERRLLFVALTRARRRLFMSFAARGRQGLPRLSRFLTGCPATVIESGNNGARRPVQQSLF